MKSFIIGMMVILTMTIFMGCNPDGGGDSGDPTTRVVEGTITVPDSTYWTYLKLGVFSGGTAGDYVYLDSEDWGSGVSGYRVVYGENNDGLDVAIQPLASVIYTINDTSGTSSSYSLELPSTLPVTDEEYVFAAWYDNNSDDTLDLKDMDPILPGEELTAAEGEFNRLPTKDTLNNDDNPTTIVITHFMESQDLDGNPSGNYKYVGYDHSSYNEQLDLTVSTHSGFNFDITANTGWQYSFSLQSVCMKVKLTKMQALGKYRLVYLRFILALLSGFLLALSYPPTSLNWLVWIALVPVFVSINFSKRLEGLIIGLITGIVFYSLSFQWVGAFHHFAIPFIALVSAFCFIAVPVLFIQISIQKRGLLILHDHLLHRLYTVHSYTLYVVTLLELLNALVE